MLGESIIAVGLLTQRDVELLGGDFKRLWPVEETPCFSGLLHAIDEADRQVRRDRAAEPECDDPPQPILRML